MSPTPNRFPLRGQPSNRGQFRAMGRASVDLDGSEVSVDERVESLFASGDVSDKMTGISIDCPATHELAPLDPDPVVRARYYEFYGREIPSHDAQARQVHSILSAS